MIDYSFGGYKNKESITHKTLYDFEMQKTFPRILCL